MERPTVNKQVSGLVDFGSVTVSGCYLQGNKVISHIGNFKYSRIQMANEQNNLLASVTPLDPDVSGFTVNYRRSK